MGPHEQPPRRQRPRRRRSVSSAAQHKGMVAVYQGVCDVDDAHVAPMPRSPKHLAALVPITAQQHAHTVSSAVPSAAPASGGVEHHNTQDSLGNNGGGGSTNSSQPGGGGDEDDED